MISVIFFKQNIFLFIVISVWDVTRSCSRQVLCHSESRAFRSLFCWLCFSSLSNHLGPLRRRAAWIWSICSYLEAEHPGRCGGSRSAGSHRVSSLSFPSHGSLFEHPAVWPHVCMKISVCVTAGVKNLELYTNTVCAQIHI